MGRRDLAEDRPLRIAVDAQITPGEAGGVVQATLGLVHALGRLRDGNEEYLIVVGSDQDAEWLRPAIGPNEKIVRKPRRWVKRDRPKKLAMALMRAILRRMMSLAGCWPEVPLSDGFYEEQGCDVVHFPHQRFVLCALPTIYNPHDLQHLRYPEFFTASAIAFRETIYQAGCHFAHTVVVASQWVKDDLVRHYRVSGDKVQVIPWGPPTQTYCEPSDEHLSRVRSKYQLEQPFAFYPAVTWPHKNHIRLLEALAHLRDRFGLTIRLVCTGSLYMTFWPVIRRKMDELGLWSQVKFLGYCPTEDMRAIYRLSQFVVVPTLFESDSFPIYEAWLEGIPVICSNATALPDQVLDAALVFDPDNLESIGDAVRKAATDADLRSELRKRGFQRIKDFDWERTGKAYRAVYRRAAGYPLTEEDRALLGWDWMRNPQRRS
jgi:glycosyltransferase involved in cell wall biosynthesis